jgi:hypothetical protein
MIFCAPGAARAADALTEYVRAQMEILHFLKARLKIERDELDQLISGSLHIHRRTDDGRLIDETEQSITRVRQLIDTLENQIKHFERQQDNR